MQGFSTYCFNLLLYSLVVWRLLVLFKLQLISRHTTKTRKHILQVKCYNRCREEMEFHFLNKYLTKCHFSTKVFFQLSVVKQNQSYLSGKQHKDTDNPVKQSKFEANTCSRRKAREPVCKRLISSRRVTAYC